MNKQNDEIKLEDLGYSDFFKNNQTPVKDTALIPARIIAEHRELYVLRNATSQFSAKITGKMMFSATSREDYPAVGDWACITVLDKDQAVINEILPRRTVLKRKSAGNTDAQIIASNIDVAFIVQSLDRDYSLNRFERYFSLAESGNIKPAIVLNKTDLISKEDLECKMCELRDRFKDSNIYCTSTVSGLGIFKLKNNIKKGLTYCFLGSSGVGKSSIINTLVGEELIETGEISVHSNRGKHITTHRQLFLLKNGGLLIDTPGMREVGLLDSNTGIKNVFSEIQGLSEKCRYFDCTHMHEPGCAVLEAVKIGELEKEKYDNYIRLVKENDFNTMSKLQKREKDRKFGKFIKNTKKQLKKYKPNR